MYVNINNHASSPWPPLPPLLILSYIPKQQYKNKQRKQQEQVTRKFSEWKQAHVGMEP